MIIQIDEALRVRGTEMSWQLERLVISKVGKRVGQGTWTAEKYYSTLQSALSGALQREIRTHPAHTITEAIEAAESLCAKYTAIFDRGVE